MKKFMFISLILAANLSADNDSQMEKKVGEFVWTELATSNVQAAKVFYGKVFGWQFTDKNMGDMTYTMVKKNDKEFGGIWAIPAAQASQIPPHWLSYILVDDIDSTLKKATQNGAKVIKPKQKAGEMGLFAILTDPTGAHFALWQPLKMEKE